MTNTRRIGRRERLQARSPPGLLPAPVKRKQVLVKAAIRVTRSPVTEAKLTSPGRIVRGRADELAPSGWLPGARARTDLTLPQSGGVAGHGVETRGSFEEEGAARCTQGERNKKGYLSAYYANTTHIL